MKLKLALLLIVAMLLTGCGYWVVEVAPVQVGEAVVHVTPVPEPLP